MATLWKSTKPAICDLGRWYDGTRLEIDNDGNCFALSWMTTALIGAAQSRRDTMCFVKSMKNLTGAFEGGEFGDVDNTSMVSSSGTRLPFFAAHVMIDTCLV